jgi:hypothetical protein
LGLVVSPYYPYNPLNRVAVGGKAVTNASKNEDWGVADRAADFLSIDREVCRRAFYREPEERVREVVRWVLSNRDLPGHDPERAIEGWARQRGAGVYGEGRRRGSLEHVGGIVARAVSGRDAAA